MKPEEHWPFGDGAGGSGRSARKDNRAHAAEDEAVRAVNNASRIAHARFDRLLVGGRAHVRKRGLS